MSDPIVKVEEEIGESTDSQEDDIFIEIQSR